MYDSYPMGIFFLTCIAFVGFNSANAVLDWNGSEWIAYVAAIFWAIGIGGSDPACMAQISKSFADNQAVAFSAQKILESISMSLVFFVVPAIGVNVSVYVCFFITMISCFFALTMLYDDLRNVIQDKPPSSNINDGEIKIGTLPNSTS